MTVAKKAVKKVSKKSSKGVVATAPAPLLRRALAAWLGGLAAAKTFAEEFKIKTPQVLAWAAQARALSQESCFFCADPRTPAQDGKKNWEGYDACGCVKRLLTPVVVPVPTTKQNGVIGGAELLALVKCVNAGEMFADDTVHVGVCCDCKTEYAVQAQEVVNIVTWHKLQAVKVRSRCTPCHRAWKAQPKGERPTKRTTKRMQSANKKIAGA